MGSIAHASIRSPGLLEKPIVRSSSPWSDTVCSVGRSRVPIQQVTPAQAHHSATLETTW